MNPAEKPQVNTRTLFSSGTAADEGGVTFLVGQQVPLLESTDMSFDNYCETSRASRWSLPGCPSDAG